MRWVTMLGLGLAWLSAGGCSEPSDGETPSEMFVTPDAGGGVDARISFDAGRDAGHDAGTDAGPPPDPPTVTGISVGGVNSCALFDDHTIKCWGRNDYGELVQGDTESRGDQPGEMGMALAPIDTGTGRRPAKLFTGAANTCVIFDDGALKCWGSNFLGGLGQGDEEPRGDQADEVGDGLPPIALGTGRSARMVALDGFACAVLDDGNLKCWGDNRYGGLGTPRLQPLALGDEPGEMGDALPILEFGPRTIETVAVSAGHACALLDDGAVRCWGNQGPWGTLGANAEITCDDAVCGPLDLDPVALGTGQQAVDVVAGVGGANCALLAGGTVKCWGPNHTGQLGLGDMEARGDQPGEMGDALPAVDLGEGAVVTAIAAGMRHFCALLSGGAVKCWGHNEDGQLGLGDTESRGDQPGEMGDALPAVDLGGAATAIASQRNHTCALLQDGSVRCWGNNEYGQLGLGDVEGRGDEPGEMGAALPAVAL